MKTLVGGLLLLAGIGGLSLWGAKDHAPQIEAAIAADAARAVGLSTHGVATAVSGRDIVVSGLADTAQERDQIVSALQAVDGRRVVADQLQILPVAQPFTLLAERADDSTRISGHVPTEAARAALSGADAGDLVLAAGAPQGWPQAAQAALDALAPLQDGTAMLGDTELSLKGSAATPTEHDAALSALAALPEGFASTVMIEVIDDGKPAFTLDYDAGALTRVSGKLPKGVSLADIAAALGLSSVTGEAFNSFGEDAGALPSFAALGAWLPEFDLLQISRAEGRTRIGGQVLPGVDLELVQAALAKALPDVTLDITQTGRGAAEGDERINSRTGQNERFSGGFWLPVLAFEPSGQNCAAQSEQALESFRINFVTGSARLDAQAVRGVNALAAVVRPCVAEAGLSLELGGHTDSTGDADANQALSALRAEAVRQALIARGVPQALIRAQGYGASQPVADNSTDAGRAANRRTTVIWSN